MKLSVIHETRYDYASPVEQAHHVVHLRPLATARQTVLSHRLTASPEPQSLREFMDSYGQPRTYFEMATPHTTLIVGAHSEVITQALPNSLSGALERVTVPDSPRWESVAEHMLYNAAQSFDASREFAQPSPLAPIDADFARYASEVASPGATVFGLAKALCQRIHSEFKYTPAATDVGTPPSEALEKKVGVCQDFAQVMIACLRSLGLSARYVSGYLLTQPPPGKPRLIGADASHAWVSVYSPEYGWLEFDPTNNCIAGESHVVVGYGRDYADVAPIRGVIRGGGTHTLKVAVTVAPSDELAHGASRQQSQTQTQTQGSGAQSQSQRG
ncbi:MAG: transglutaminase family protein [Burkholderiales bacterium]|nr:MAG: transglutaminase family protein [Burkholderiales bacterium]